VCTPIQVDSIATALIDRLKRMTDFKTCFAVARLYHGLKQNESMKIQRWRDGYLGMIAASKDWPESELNRWKEVVEGEIESAGYEVFEILGEDFSYPIIRRKKLDSGFMILWLLQAPISFGPMGHTLTFLFKSVMREQSVFNGKNENIAEFYSQRMSALNRYLAQLALVDQFIQLHDAQVSQSSIDEEVSMVKSLFGPARSSEDVIDKVSRILDDYITIRVAGRIDRLRRVAEILRSSSNLSLFDHAPDPIRAAYMVLRNNYVPDGVSSHTDKKWQRMSRVDAGQDSLMVLALHGWKPMVCVC
jgi:hypothetical protein